MTLVDFTLSNARRFYSIGNPLAVKGLTTSKTNALTAVGALTTQDDT